MQNKKRKERSIVMDRRTAKDILLSSLPAYLEQNGININKKFNCMCPEHMDNTPSMQYDKRRNICHCFSCGANADIFQLIEWQYNTTSFEETLHIACDMFGIDLDDRKHKENKIKMKPAKKKWASKVSQKEPEKADEYIRNKVYQAMRDIAPLTEKDIRYLKEVRRLDDKRIKKDYFRIPSESNKKETFLRKLKKITGYNNDTLKTVPGFFVNKSTKKLDYHSEDGIAILIRNVNGSAYAVQIRHDTTEKGRRYSWFSSGFAVYDENLDGGCSPGAAKDIIIPKNPKKCICITEGRFKSEILSQYNNIVISIQGVSTWKGINEIISEIKERYDITGLFMMFDSDVMGNTQLMHTLKNMTISIKAAFPDMLIAVGAWKIEYGKGIDDCIINGYLKKVKFIDAMSFFSTCEKNIDVVMRENGFKSLKKLKKEAQKEFKQKLQSTNEKLLNSA